MSEWVVDSFHVNVGQGDGAVHLLVEVTGTAKVIHRATFIDGGKGEGYKRIDGVIDRIEKTLGYTFPPGITKLQFDSMVVTHWDEDHWKGVVEYINLDIARQVEKLTDPTADDIKKLPCSRFKYEGNDRSKPETTFYAPYWTGAAESIRKTPGPSKRAKSGGDRPEALDEKKKGFMDFRYEEPKKPKKRAKKGDPPPPPPKKLWLYKLCRLSHTPKEMLGVNFFTNVKMTKKNYKDVTSPADLIANVDLKEPVGIFCVASNGAVMGNRDSSWPILAAAAQDMPPVSVFMIDEENDKKNWPSVGAVVLWKGNKRVSHYFAGDAMYKTEDKLTDWVGGNVKSMKLSHHGAATSTPINMLDKFQPANIIVSAGQEYGHPRWELLFYLNAWVLSTDYKGNKPVYLTRYPYYLRTNVDDPTTATMFPNKDIKLTAFIPTKSDEPRKDFVKNLKKLYENINSASSTLRPLKDIKTQFDEWLPTKPTDTAGEKFWDYNNRAWISHQVEEAWQESLSPMYTRDAGRKKMTDYIMVRSREDINEDGSLDIREWASGAPDAGLYTAPTPIVKNALHAAQALDPIDSNPAPLFGNIPPSLLASHSNPIPTPSTGFTLMSSAGTPDHGDNVRISRRIWMASDEPSAEDGTGYYFASSQSDSTDPRVKKVDIDTPLDAFLSALHSQKIGLSSKPTENSATAFCEKDEWILWFKDAISAKSLVAKSDKDGDLSGFSLEMELPGEIGGQTISLDTDYIDHAFEVPEDIKPPIGLLGQEGVMVFGLGPKNPILHTDLQKALEYVGLEKLKSSPLAVALSSIGLTLSPKDNKGARNAVWFQPGRAYRTLVRLQWDIDGMDKVKEYLSFLKDIQLSSVHIITRRTATWAMTSGGLSVTTTGEISLSVQFKIGGTDFIGALTFGQDSVCVELTTSTRESILSDIVKWLESCTGAQLPFADWLSDTICKKIHLRKIRLQVNDQKKITDFSVAVEVQLGVAGEATVLLTYASGRKQLRGMLWFESTKSTSLPSLLFPDWERTTEFTPLTPAQKPSFDLATLLPDGVGDIPRGIPHEVTEASLEIDSTTFAFVGTITCGEPKNDVNKVPMISLGQVSLDFQYIFGGAQKGDFLLKLEVDVEISAPPESEYQTPTKITGSLDYDGAEWTLRGSMKSCFASTLYQFFDPDSRDEVMKSLEALELHSLDLVYHYQKGVGSDFKFEGSLLLGDLELDLTYKYDAKDWSFDAVLGAKDEKSNIGSILESITGDEDLLPPFVADIPVAPAGNGGAVSVHYSKKSKDEEKDKEKKDSVRSSGKGGSFLFFSASVKISKLKATFMQYQDLDWPKSAKPKRIFKVSVAELEAITVDGVGTLPQPFDEMFYMWVQDKTPQVSTKKLPGLAKKEVEGINNALDQVELVFKENRKEDAAVVITAGSHFVLVLKERDTPKVILDYTFGADKKKKEASAEVEAESETEMYALAEGTAKGKPSGSAGGESSVAPYKKSIGPISISNIGFRYNNNTLSILLDAAFALGPIGFELLGFSIDLNLKGADLHHIPTPDFSLSGLAVKFDRPPLRLAGSFRYVNNEDIKYYAGGIVISFTPYLFAAAGFYGEMKKPDPFTSVFVFGKLEGPLIVLEFAEISGITGGLGYNSEMRFPAIAEVPSFPFVAGTGVGDDIMKTLENLVNPDGAGWFKPRNNSFWVAAGLKVTALETLSIDAVVAVSWDPSVKLGIFGVAVADIPRGSPVKFAHVELGMSAVVDFQAGVMKFEAQLSPNSYIFAPSCHLTGGFALYYWFSGSAAELEGDWVFTIGGFHRAFDKPKHYPSPPRLAISWSVDSNISITGEAYFAITPKCCMGGGRLVATLTLGPLRAWFDAYADFLINYKPFHFMADGGVSVGVSCKVDLLLTSFTVQVEIGARLHLEGPPLCGRVHVDFWVMAFDIDFGPNPETAKPVSLQEFYTLVLQAGDGSSLSSDKLLASGDQDVESDEDKAHVFGCRNGLLVGEGEQRTEENQSWKVRSGTFAFGISCRFALNEAHVLPSNEFRDDDEKKVPELPEVGSKTPIYAKPMHLTEALQSEMEISIERTDTHSAILMAEEDSQPHQWQIKKIEKAVPSALWGKYNPGEDPQTQGNNIGNLLNGKDAAIKLLMGVEITAPKPTLSPDKIPKFNAIDAMSESVNEQGSEPIFPQYDSANAKWSPEEVKDEKAQWDKVKSLWQAPELGTKCRDSTMDLWKQVMFWQNGVKADTPTLLLEKFDNLYLTAPLISVG